MSLLVLVTVQGFQSIDSLALEQKARCGLQEHRHTQACYAGDVLLCTEKAHTHSSNCYLVLLEDNDINLLLRMMEATDNRSLEGVIDSALVQALALNDSFAQTPPPVSLTAQDVTALNTTIQENEIQPEIVLNENLADGTVLTYAPEQGQGKENYAVGDLPVTGTRKINFYIQLDGKIVLVNSGTLTSGNPEYFSYANTAKAYTDVVVTTMTSTTIGSGYFFRYNTTGSTSSASDFSYNASYSNNRVRFANTNNTQYALLSQRTYSGGRYVYSPIPFHTVKLDYSEIGTNIAPTVRYVQNDVSSGLTLSNEYIWYDANGNEVTQMPARITETITLYARHKAFTATFEDQAGKQLSPSYTGEPTGGSLKVTLPALTGTDKEGYIWIDKNSDGTVWYRSDGSATVSITEDTAFVAIPSKYTVTFVGENNITIPVQMDYLDMIALGDLPEGWLWEDENGVQYMPGDSYGPIREDMTITAVQKRVAIHYSVNFPSSAASQVDFVPTIYGTTSLTITDSSPYGQGVTARNLTSRTARDEVSSSNKESVTYFFKGWTIPGTDLLIQPDATIPWQTILAHVDENDSVQLQGVWENGGRYNSATFFVRFDSAAVDTNGNITSQPSENYTPEVFNTHVGGIDTSLSDEAIKKKYNIADTTSDNSYGADQAIRALYGEKATGAWFYDFPSDDHVFTYLIDYLNRNPGKQLTVEGDVVNPKQLNHSYYAIRWYVFKLEGSTWHIDGKLVKKEGSITIDKTFGGDEAVLEAEKDGFYILAENGTMSEDGVFTPYPANNEKFKQNLLVVNKVGAQMLHTKYPNATILIFDSETDNKHHYEWIIEGVELGEYWHIEEFPVEIPGYSCYAEYSVYDTDGEHTAIAAYGTRASAVGKTFALDEDPDQGLMVDFRNYYHPVETILIKKEDAKTGMPIGGAEFELWQNGNRLTFNFDEATGQYIRDEGGNGAFSRIITSADGYSIISTTGFSYDYGDVVVKEVVSPAGYDPAPAITLGKDSAGKVVLKDVADTDREEWSDFASVPDNDTLVVRNYAAQTISVTVNKVWNTNAPADSVEVVLQANGQNAAALFPGMANVQVVLNGGNAWQHTWTDLPRYANGEIVRWSVKEVVIGGKPTLADGTTFANWTVTYSPGHGTDTDGDGDVDSWNFTITNSTRRLQMILTKVGTEGELLPGCVFSLEQVALVNGQWQPVPGTEVNIQTTDQNGMLTFDNLLTDTYWRLTEVSAPSGYFAGFNEAILTIDGAGVIRKAMLNGTQTDLNSQLIQYTRPYNIQVTNIPIKPLPQTGGIGTTVYLQSGWLLIAVAALLLYKNKRRKEDVENS